MTTMQTIGKYEIIGELGRGGFAVVYEARDTALDRPVALKVLHPHWSSDPDAASRFLREARLSARLRHPNIVTVYETGEADGRYFLAMAYLPGRTLRELLTTGGALPLARALPILDQIARALDYAHGQGVIHRDVKPANIIIEETGDGLQATLTDFGLVKALAEGSSLTSLGTVIGSPEYMAPEQADPNRAAEVGPATDLYALGIVAYEMLTGRVPFPGNTPSTLYAHEYKPPRPPRELRPDLSEAVEAVLLKMLTKAPTNRYPTAGAFVTALQAAQVKTHPSQPSPAAHFKWVWGAAVGLLIVACLIGLWLGEVSGWLFLPPLRPTLPLEKTETTVAVVTSPSATLEPPTPTPMPSPTPTFTPLPPPPTSLPALEVGPTRARQTDGMTLVYVPAGSFTMGSDNWLNNENPRHSVTLNAFWLDRTEVTNAQYNRCVKAGKCQASAYTNDSQLDGADYPVVGVSWQDAVNYCQWVGGRLPTEAEWEYAARGPENRVYPWGNEFDPAKANTDRFEFTAPVGSYPTGASWVGAQDMAGNVYEWVGDWYDSTYYAISPAENPPGPDTGTLRVLRGGSWTDNNPHVRATYRNFEVPGHRSTDFGFRCVVSPGS